MKHRYFGPLRRSDGQRQRGYATFRAPRDMPIAGRILMHTLVDPDTECWVWQLALVPQTGYGALTIDGKALRAHRASCEAFVGPIPEGKQIDHLCRNRACVNPMHLEPVTALVNNRRSPLTHGSETHCPHGHEYNDRNTYVRAGRRHCRTCRKAYRILYFSLTPEQRAERKVAGLPVVDLAAYFAEQPERGAA